MVNTLKNMMEIVTLENFVAGKRSIIFERVMCVYQVLVCTGFTGLLGFLRPQATKGFIIPFFIWDLFWGKVINPLSSTFEKEDI